MPKPRSRRNDDSSPQDRREHKDPTASGRWVAPTMVALLLLGLAWIVAFYLAENELPLIRDLGGWNLLIGMGLVTSGFVVATRWK